LKPGFSAQQASDEIRRIGSMLAREFPESDQGFAFDALPLTEQIIGRSRTTFFLLLGAVGFVLLMACANVAHLLLARAAARQRDIAVRMALGASGFRLLRELFVEGAVLASIGAAVGIGLAVVGLRFLIATGPAALVRTHDIGLDLRALLFTAAVAIASAIASGLPPAWRVSRSDVGSALRQGGRSVTAGHHRLRAGLVVLQVAVALVLLVGAGLLIHSFLHVLDVNAGFDAHNMVTISTQVPSSARKPEQRVAIYQQMREQLLSVAGVLNVDAVSRLPLLGSDLGSWLFVEGKTPRGEQGPDIEYRVATPGYFSTMRIPLLRGRFFDEHDDATPAAVALIDETAARKFWPGEDPVGKRIKLGANPDRLPWITIAGVVGSVRHSGIDAEPRPHVYRPYALNPLSAPILVIRTASDPGPLINTLTAKIRSVNPAIPAYNVFRMEQLVERSTAQRRFVMLLLTGFAAAAVLLALVGIYGTVSQSVVQRTQEIGVRMALGASPATARSMILREGFRLTAVGIAAGSVAALGLTRLMRSMLFEVRPLDPGVFLAAALTLGAFALLACYGPARRATRVDPVIALRQDG
jgi:putative ABC transport system permease protein